MSVNFYSAPSHMSGGYVVYGGYRRQRGAGMFGSFRKMMAPVGRGLKATGRVALRGLRTTGRHALKGLKSVSKNAVVRDIAKQAAQKAAEAGAQVLSNVAVDALSGRNIGESIKEHGRQTLLNQLTDNTSPTQAPRKKSKRSKRLQRKVLRKKKLKQKKRVATSLKSIKHSVPARKRRRTLSLARLNREELF